MATTGLTAASTSAATRDDDTHGAGGTSGTSGSTGQSGISSFKQAGPSDMQQLPSDTSLGMSGASGDQGRIPPLGTSDWNIDP
ncbi:unnamed protein product [Didymodactylos carnosus]|uniref:Uncharacterized protein n=1 Tax=Didymodactylos carnosus TaxID=1234261 RepID=A0A814TW25_9BILA|nr:unnamed protein product [Didymodactylos carnosus]CAF1163509.1 unnamed protein product [Didymodactylos carnosus]CAF3778896.1 unnamed protein product [Didymodactylos carnosus]CAF3927134.1 unnamed protein product [Didymodactylos carnosus]